MKFGGTSVGTAESIRQVAYIVAQRIHQKPVVVVSAVAGVTDLLVELSLCTRPQQKESLFKKIAHLHYAILDSLEMKSSLVDALLADLHAVIKKKTPKNYPQYRDVVVSFGERMSSRIVAAAIQSTGNKARAYDAWDVGMCTTPVHGNSEPLQESPRMLQKKISRIKNEIPVITGFIGKTRSGKITTLGRGGSDYTTAIIGGALRAREIQIWKEVDGVLSTDPRVVPQARLIPTLHYEEASELAYFGAKVLHPKTMLPAMLQKVPIRVLNTFKPDGEGTLITSSVPENSAGRAKAISVTKGTTVVTLHTPDFYDGSGLMARIFSVFEKNRVSVDVISTSVVSVSCSYASNLHTDKLVKELSKIGRVEVSKDCAVVCAVGAQMNNARVIRDACHVFDKENIPVRMISESASGTSVTFLVHESNAKQSVVSLHKALIERI